MHRIPALQRLRRRAGRDRWSDTRMRQIRDEVLETAYRAGLYR
jgi:hypothetical protein